MKSDKSPQKVDAIFVCCGGGGLISGIAVATHKKATVIGCQPKNSEVMLASIKAGKIVDLEYIPVNEFKLFLMNAILRLYPTDQPVI